MAIFRGDHLTIDIYGESHAPCVGAKVTGMPSFRYDEEALSRFLARRKASGSVYSTARIEADEPHFVGLDGNLVGSNFEVSLDNANTKSTDYADLYGKPRPAHADYAWHLKDGTLDFCGGGRFSARLTAPLAVVGGLCKQYLAQHGVEVHAYVASVGQATGTSYKDKCFYPESTREVDTYDFPALSGAKEMLDEIASAKADLDSVGGRIECIAMGVPAGLGDNLFEGLEGKMACLLYAIPAVKGVEFGYGFDLARMRGSQANDPMYYDEEGAVRFATNCQGGLGGGITNGNYLSVGVAVKPTPSIAKEQRTVDLVNHQNTTICIHGRHDACVVPRAVPVVESAVCIALVDEMLK